jgi:hypothetical protein
MPRELQLRKGERVLATCKGSKKQYPGKIYLDNRDGTYDVKFDDGDRDRAVHERGIKQQSSDATTRGGISDDDAAPVKLREGDKVEARCKGSKKHYAGKVYLDNRDGTYDVKFDDGDRDRAVKKADIISKSGSGGGRSDSDSDAKLSTGDKVEARCKGSKKHYAGKVYLDNRDGTYDVKFDDGDRDRAVPKADIKNIASGAGKSSSAFDGVRVKLRPGDKVEARCKGSKKHYAGKIFLDNRDGTYDVKFDDGDRDKFVPDSSIKKVGGTALGIGSPSRPSAILREGDKVMASCKGSKKHYAGKIFIDNRDGTYDVKFDDGDRDKAVPKGSITAAGNKSSLNTSRVSTSGLDVGDAVEANFRGRGNWFPGKIRKKNADGSFDILYDDNEQEFGVVKFNVRAMRRGGSPTRVSTRPTVGVRPTVRKSMTLRLPG